MTQSNLPAEDVVALAKPARFSIGDKVLYANRTTQELIHAATQPVVKAALPWEFQEEIIETLRWVINDVQDWVEAVSKDASWDGWDQHYKSFAYGGLDKAKASLNKAIQHIQEGK